jgi:nitrogen fixation protein NifQ
MQAGTETNRLLVATDRHSPDAILFARLIAARDAPGEWLLLGLGHPQLCALFARHFPHAAAPPRAAVTPLARQEHADFAARMHAFLLAHASSAVNREDAACLAAIIANACLRPDHLWRDLGLAGREEVTQMLERYFPELVKRNVDGLRWKKLLARELALSEGMEPGPAPGCPGCEDYGHCFPPAQ